MFFRLTTAFCKFNCHGTITSRFNFFFFFWCFSPLKRILMPTCFYLTEDWLKWTVFLRKNVTLGRPTREAPVPVSSYLLLNSLETSAAMIIHAAAATQCDLWTSFMHLTSSSYAGHVDIVKKNIGGVEWGSMAEKKNITENSRRVHAKSYLWDGVFSLLNAKKK